MLTFVFIVVLLAGLGAVALLLTKVLQTFRAQTEAGLAARNADVERRLQGLTDTLDRRLGTLDEKVDRRLEHASKQTNAIHQQLGDVGRATSTLAEHAKELGQLQQVLRPPKARGGFGELLEKAFARDVKGHVDTIAEKYIRPDEGTYDFAFMYHPSEAIYYELVCGKTGTLLAYA